MSILKKAATPGFWLVVACVAIFGAMAVTAEPDGDRPDRPNARQRGPMFQMFKDLDLSDEQRQEIRTIFKAAKEKRQAAMAEHKEELDKIDAKIRELMEQRRKLMPDREAVIKQVSGVLTPEQQDQFKKKMESLHSNSKPRHMNRRPDRGAKRDNVKQ